MNKNYLNELKDIQNIANKIKSMRVNENINFEDEQEFDELEAQQQDVNGEQPVPQETPEQQQGDLEGGMEPTVAPEKDENPEEKGMKELDQMGEVDQIRRITLDGMRKLADHPEHPQFQALLKIFQICNKAVEKDDDNENASKI